MPFPKTALSTLRPDLAGSLVEFDLAADRAGFVGLRLFPALEVQEAAGSLGRIELADILRADSTQRASGSGYSRTDWGNTELLYSCKEHGEEVPVDDRQARALRNYFDAEMVSAAIARDRVLRNHEIRVVTKVTDTGVFTGAPHFLNTTLTGNNGSWATASSCDPIKDVEFARDKIFGKSGLTPNVVCLNWRDLEFLKAADAVVEKIHSMGAGTPTKAGDITPAILASAFGVDQVIVAGGAKNTANKGQTAAISRIWPDGYVFVGRVAAGQSPVEPCIGRTVHWGEDGSQIGAVVESYRDENARANIIRSRMDTDELAMMLLPAGFLLRVRT